MQMPQMMAYADTMRIGIMGGTFNPVHCGHICMAEAALHSFALSQVLFIPTGRPPHKQRAEVADGEHRLHMLRLACAENPLFDVSDIEVRREGVTYTVDTLRELHGLYPEGTEFVFLVGSDTLFQIPKWREYRTVLGLCSFVVFPRKGADQSGIWEQIRQLRMQGGRIWVAETECPEVSSSGVRQMHADGFAIDGLVPEAVLQYIQAQGLYRRTV